MERDAARDRLERMVAKDSAPALSDQDIEKLLDDARRPDLYGRGPDDANWVGTYDLNAAAAAGFRMKAAKVAGDFDFSADGASFDKGKVAKQLDDHAEVLEKASATALAASALGSTRILSPTHGEWDDRSPIVNQ